MPHGLDHIVHAVHDLDAVAEFYASARLYRRRAQPPCMGHPQPHCARGLIPRALLGMVAPEKG